MLEGFYSDLPSHYWDIDPWNWEDPSWFRLWLIEVIG